MYYPEQNNNNNNPFHEIKTHLDKVKQLFDEITEDIFSLFNKYFFAKARENKVDEIL